MGNERLAHQLYESGCVQFGSFRLKSGLMSPIYLDLRLLVSVPSVLEEAADAMAALAAGCTFDRLAAIPYAGIPLGVALSLATRRPLIYPRRDVKEYGTRRAIEGAHNAGEVVLIVDDLITRGDSKLEAIEPLEQAGLVVHDVVVLVDREQGGADDLARRGYRLHAVFGLHELIDELEGAGLVDREQAEHVRAYLAEG
jgi:uridine monophosphate synthetase